MFDTPICPLPDRGGDINEAVIAYMEKLHFDIRQYNCIDWTDPTELAKTASKAYWGTVRPWSARFLMPERRFPPHWSKDSAGQKLAYVYYEEEPGRRSAASNDTAHLAK
jgi:hypothetical protein